MNHPGEWMIRLVQAAIRQGIASDHAVDAVGGTEAKCAPREKSVSAPAPAKPGSHTAPTRRSY